MESDQEHLNDSPSSLVAIIRAAHMAGDKRLERAARRELDERFGIKLTITTPKPEIRKFGVVNV